MGAQPDPRDDSQQARERAMTEVSDVLTNVEHAITRAKKARARLGSGPDEHNAQLALADALKSLEAVRKRLQRDTYFGGDELRLV